MDNSKTNIKMCEKAEEIQKLSNYTLGNYFYQKGRGIGIVVQGQTLHIKGTWMQDIVYGGSLSVD